MDGFLGAGSQPTKTGESDDQLDASLHCGLLENSNVRMRIQPSGFIASQLGSGLKPTLPSKLRNARGKRAGNPLLPSNQEQHTTSRSCVYFRNVECTVIRDEWMGENIN